MALGASKGPKPFSEGLACGGVGVAGSLEGQPAYPGGGSAHTGTQDPLACASHCCRVPAGPWPRPWVLADPPPMVLCAYPCPAWPRSHHLLAPPHAPGPSSSPAFTGLWMSLAFVIIQVFVWEVFGIRKPVSRAILGAPGGRA